MNIPFGEIREDGVWFVSWVERAELLELYIGASGHTDLHSAEEEFYQYVRDSDGRFLEKDFEPLPDAIRAQLEAYAEEEDE